MNNSGNEIEMQQSFRSPPRRRRSTFFERRDSIVPQPMLEDTENVLTRESEIDMRQQELSRYYDKLLAEKEQWKREAHERRNKYHDLRQQFIMEKEAPSRYRTSYTALTNEDIEFLKAKPNLSKLIDSQQKFHKSIKETMALTQKAMKLDEFILNFCEDKVSKITEHILEHSNINASQ